MMKLEHMLLAGAAIIGLTALASPSAAPASSQTAAILPTATTQMANGKRLYEMAGLTARQVPRFSDAKVRWMAAREEAQAYEKEVQAFRRGFITPLEYEIGQLERQLMYMRANPGDTAASGIARLTAQIAEKKAAIAPVMAKFEEMKRREKEMYAAVAKLRGAF